MQFYQQNVLKFNKQLQFYQQNVLKFNIQCNFINRMYSNLIFNAILSTECTQI